MVHLLLFCTMTNKCTIISHIIVLPTAAFEILVYLGKVLITSFLRMKR